MAKGHSSFNEEIFVPPTGSLEHALVPGKSVSSPLCGSLSQSELVKEALSDPSFLKQVRGLEAMLCVRARAVAPDGAHSDAGVSPVSSGRAARKTDSIDALFETSGAVHDGVVPRSVAGASVDAVAPCAASVGKGFATNKCDLGDGMGTETDSERVLVTAAHDAVIVAAEESRQAGLTVACGLSLDSQNSRIHLGCLTVKNSFFSSGMTCTCTLFCCLCHW